MSKGIVALVTAVVVLAICAGAASAADSPKAYASDKTASLKHQDWMSWVRDDVTLDQLTFPGTHDTVSRYGTVRNTVTQELCGNSKADSNYGKGCDVTAQLDAGIRAFDLRLACQKNGKGQKYLKAYHGIGVPVHPW